MDALLEQVALSIPSKPQNVLLNCSLAKGDTEATWQKSLVWLAGAKNKPFSAQGR